MEYLNLGEFCNFLGRFYKNGDFPKVGLLELSTPVLYAGCTSVVHRFGNIVEDAMRCGVGVQPVKCPGIVSEGGRG